MVTKRFKWLFLYLTMIISLGYGQSTPTKSGGQPELTGEKVTALGPEYNLIRPMIGNWRAVQRTWTKAGAQPLVSPAYQVRRQLIGHFLQEVIEPISGTKSEPFTRTTYLNFNNANRRWEYIVLDTRYPVMMFETSAEETLQKGNQLTLYLDAFVMPPLGEKALGGQLAKQRRTITFNSPDQQIARQYWTLPAGKEYLAIEYVYTRVREAKPASK